MNAGLMWLPPPSPLYIVEIYLFSGIKPGLPKLNPVDVCFLQTN